MQRDTDTQKTHRASVYNCRSKRAATAGIGPILKIANRPVIKYTNIAIKS